MKSAWPTTTVGASCTITSGGTPSKSNPAFWRGTIPWVSAKDLKFDRIESAELHISNQAVAQSATKIAPVGSLLMLVRGMGLANGVAIGEVTSPVAFNQDLRAIHPPKSINSRYLLLALRNQLTPDRGDGVLSSAAHGTLKIDADKLRRIPFPVPPLPEQKRIVGILDEAFEGIATAEANAEQNLRNARGLFESHLNDAFTARGPRWESTTLAQATGGIFTGPFGSLLHKRDYIANGIPLVNPAHISEVGIEPDRSKTVSKATASRLKNYVMRKGDIVIGRRGEMGRCALVTEIEDGWLCGTGSFFIKPSDRCDARYLVRYLRSDAAKARLAEIAGGAVMPNLSNTDLGNLGIELPPRDRQIAIVEAVGLLHDETRRLEGLYERKLAALHALKESLLHHAYSGLL